jgi:hypothetical protein
MKKLGIQVALILGTIAIAWRLLASYGQKAQALRRVGLLAFAAFAVWSILNPGLWTRLANSLGVGRGADLVLYGLVVAFFGFVVTTFRRFRQMETRYTRLARRIALDEAISPAQHRATRRSEQHDSSRTAPPTVLNLGRGGTNTVDGADTVDPAIPPRPTSEHP